METIYKFIDKLTPTNYYLKLITLSISCLLISIVCNIIISELFHFELVNNHKAINIIKKSKIIQFLTTVILGPFTETILLQWLPVYFYNEYKKSNKTDHIFILIFSLIFGLLHTYGIGYQISTFIIGLMYLTLTMYYADKKQNFYFPIVLIHVFNNLVVFIASSR
jgi:membrane protease YdiL (CAAX protease family)